MTRLGLTQRVEVVEAYGERRDCLDQEWTVLLDAHDFQPFPLPNRIDTVPEYLDTLDLDGVILTSGNDLAHLDNPTDPAPERDRLETAVLSYALDTGLPVLGVCRGLEFLNTHFGGSLTQVDGHVAEDHTVTFENVEEMSIELPSEAMVNSYHDFGIQPTDVADELTILGRASDNSVECVVHEKHPVVGIMWHPERESPSAALDRQILRHLFGYGNQ